MSFCICSISKMCRMSRTILEPDGNRFGYANGPPPRYMWGHLAARCPHMYPTPHSSFTIFKSFYEFINPAALPPPFPAGCVLFNTSTPCMSGPFYPMPLPVPRTGGPIPGSKEGKEPRLSIHDHIVYIGFIPRLRDPFRRRIGSQRSSKPVVGMVIAAMLTFSARLRLRRGENWGLTSPPGGVSLPANVYERR
jgi:hypothetical protein